MSSKKIIEVEVTNRDLEQMRTEGIAGKDLPKLGIKRYRPARHIIKNKGKIMIPLNSKLL